MDTDPNPFRESPDRDRSASPAEAPDDSTRDFTTDEDAPSTAGSAEASDDDEKEESSSSSTGTPDESRVDTPTTAQPAGSGVDSDAQGESRPV